MAEIVKAEFKTEKISKDGSKRHQFIVKLAEKVRQDDMDRAVWKQKQVIASNQRLGVRRRTDSPYPGYQEVPVPTTDKIIKQKKSIFTSVATQPSKQILVQLDQSEEQNEQNRQKAKDIERAMNNLVRKKDFGWAKKVNLFCDYFLENGHALFKVIEKFFTNVSIITVDLDEDFTEEQEKQFSKLKDKDLIGLVAQKYGFDPEDEDDKDSISKGLKDLRAGKRVIKLEKRTFTSEPSVIPVRGINIIVPNGSTEVQSNTRITHDMWVNYEYLKARADAGIYNAKVVAELSPDSGTNDDSLHNVNWALNEGLTNTQSASSGGELFNLRESETWYNNEETGNMEKWVFAWLESTGADSKKSRENSAVPKSVKVLQEAKLEYEHGLFTYVKHDLEYKNVRWYNSRGVPEQIRGMHIITEKMFNARVIRDTYNNAPMFRVSKQLGWSGDEMRMRPGQVLEGEKDQIEQINKQVTTDISSAQIEAQAKAYIEEYQAIPDLARTQGGSKEKTATEVQAVTSALSQQAGTDVALFLESLSEVSVHMHWIIKQSVTKPTKVGGVTLTPEHFAIKTNPSWVGSIEASNPGLMGNKALQRVQTLAQGMTFGIVTQEDMYNGYRQWLLTDNDIENPDDFITKPQEILADQVEQQGNEIVLMINGLNAKVKPDDQHGTHLQVIEEWIATPNGKAAMQNEQIAQKVQEHANVHVQAEQLQQGGGGGRPRA